MKEHVQMTQPTNKFEQLLELLINEENDKAEQLFHDIVVEKSRDIYENLADSETATTETKDETKEDDKKEEVKETEKSDEKKEEKKDETVDETKEDKPAEEKIKDEGVFTRQPAPVVKPTLATQPVKSDEESIEEIGGDPTDELVKDIASDEEGEADAAADELGQDMDADGEEAESTEERVADLEDALDELKAEFEKMLGDKGEELGEPEEGLEPVIPAQETQPEMSRFEGKDEKAKEDKKETVKEYKIQKSADNADGSDKSAKSPVASGPKVKSAATPVKTGSGAEDKGRPAPTAKKIEGSFENSPAKDKSTSYKKEVKADSKDGSDKSAKSPVASGK